MSDKTGYISDEYHGFIDQNTHDCIEVVGGFITNTAVGEG